MQATILSYVLACGLPYVLAFGLTAAHNLRWYQNPGPAKSIQR
jgi:hypothetical protein